MSLEQFVGKEISFEDESGEKFEGTCETIKSSHFFFSSWKAYIIFDDRTPVTNVNLETIKIIK